MEQHELVKTYPIEQLVNRIGAEAVFGTPTSENGTIIIPVAQAEFGFGYGGGYGHSANGEEAAAESGDKAVGAAQHSGEGGGAGGAGGGRATPRGYIRISPDAVTFEPIEDETRVPLAAMLLGAWSIFWITATIRVIARSVAKTKQVQMKN